MRHRVAIILDLDDTLHSSAALAQAYADLAVSLVARRRGLDREAADRVVRERREELSRAAGEGVRVTMSHTLESLGIPLREWVETRDRELDPAPLVKRDERLRRLLERLAPHCLLAILTNNSRLHAEAITRAIGIRDLFEERIFTVTETLILKPDPEVFRRVAGALGLPPEACVSVGDRPSVDIEPARLLGMRGIAVDPPDGIYPVLEDLIAEFSSPR